MDKCISIIIPTFKPDSYIYDCLESLSNQTLDMDNFEIIVVLNGDKNPYFSLIQNFCLSKNINITLLYTSQKGVSNARNYGLKHASGRFVCFIDDDDIITENYLASMLSLIDKDDVRSNSIVICNTIGFEDNITNISENYISNHFKKYYLKQSENTFQMRKFLSTPWGKLIPREVINECLFNVNYHNGEDSLFMAQISNNIKTFILTDETVIYYQRIRKNSASNKKRLLNELISTSFKLIKEYLNLLFVKGYNKYFILSRVIAQFKNIYLYIKQQKIIYKL